MRNVRLYRDHEQCSSCRRILSVRQSFPNSTAERSMLPAYCSSLGFEAAEEN